MGSGRCSMQRDGNEVLLRRTLSLVKHTPISHCRGVITVCCCWLVSFLTRNVLLDALRDDACAHPLEYTRLSPLSLSLSLSLVLNYAPSRYSRVRLRPTNIYRPNIRRHKAKSVEEGCKDPKSSFGPYRHRPDGDEPTARSPKKKAARAM